MLATRIEVVPRGVGVRGGMMVVTTGMTGKVVVEARTPVREGDEFVVRAVHFLPGTAAPTG